jgi:iron-sulfur cluster repair protein YtfE (RIC family)
MSFLDRITEALTPTETEQERASARTVALSLAGEGDWLATVLDHHRRIESLFTEALASDAAGHRTATLMRLSVLLTGHAQAEESVLYPELADADQKDHAMLAYEEQALTKVQMGQLAKLDPLSDGWVQKLATIRDAVLHHVYQEEGKWFPALQQRLLPADRGMIDQRFKAEFERYLGSEHATPI